ncbi:uncharacterized protein [Magallana gigas]|uniref:uncharacterized protein isoform X3 n=1 Tax=Magallana gigas TaxID=29159 RepID=UPI00148AC5B0|nr:uncharacterized protein LOC117688070 isoform X2 [Crassostrea gigas]
MSGLYIVQVAICICFMDGFDGQPLYEDKCHVDEMDRRFNGAYNREVVLQRQIGRLKNQLDSFRETIERLQFHLGCLDENGTYLEENVTKSQYCFIKAPFNWKNAKGKCQSFGSHLLEINTESEQKWLYDKDPLKMSFNLYLKRAFIVRPARMVPFVIEGRNNVLPRRPIG